MLWCSVCTRMSYVCRPGLQLQSWGAGDLQELVAEAAETLGRKRRRKAGSRSNTALVVLFKGQASLGGARRDGPFIFIQSSPTRTAVGVGNKSAAHWHCICRHGRERDRWCTVRAGKGIWRPGHGGNRRRSFSISIHGPPIIAQLIMRTRRRCSDTPLVSFLFPSITISHACPAVLLPPL